MSLAWQSVFPAKPTCHCEGRPGPPPQTSGAFAVGIRRRNGMSEACRCATRWKSPKRRRWRIQRGGFEAGPRLSRPTGARDGWANDEGICSLRRRCGNPYSPQRRKAEVTLRLFSPAIRRRQAKLIHHPHPGFLFTESIADFASADAKKCNRILPRRVRGKIHRSPRAVCEQGECAERGADLLARDPLISGGFSSSSTPRH